ncbi:MAG: hypothetical protein JSR59_01945 [Proteobacteria bacterium]|nr:hypothetical protein [Pseudomonadota bacterium]
MALNRLSARHALGLAALLPLAAHAGLSLDEALMRHHALLASDAMPDAFQPNDATPDGIVAAVGGPGETIPPLLRPVLPGVGGVQWTHRGGTADGLHWRAGVGWRDTDAHSLSLDGSELAYGLGSSEVYLSVQRRHWGPSWVGSLILDSAAPAIPSFGWRKNAATPFESPWLSWLGPWTADVFFGELSGHVQPEHPKLIGMRVQFMPLAGLEVGVSRAIEWGGSGRPESLSALWQALVGHDNPVNAAGFKEEPGNQLGGFDLRYALRAGGIRYSIYAQGIGEDEANGMPTKYLGSAGIDAAFDVSGNSVRLFVESANTIAGGIANQPYPGVAYRHHVYLQGYTEQGKSLAFPAGGDVTLTSLGMLVDAGALSGMLMLHTGHAHEDAQFYPTPGSLSGANATLAWRINPDWRVGAQVDTWRDPQTSQVRGQLWVQYRLP